MFRSFFVSLSRSAWARHTFSKWGIAKRLASRFIAGESLGEAMQAVRQLNLRGIQATLDHLGENTTTFGEANRAVGEISQILDEIERSGARANVSIKLSQIGLNLDQDICDENLMRILKKACDSDNFVRIDMEDSSLTDQTLAAFFRAGKINTCGVVLQSYLYRSQADLERVLSVGGKVRLCKGAYQEPPEIAYPQKRDVDENYLRLAELLLKGALQVGNPRLSSDGRIPPLMAFATHDERLIQKVRASAASLNVPKEAIEFQMLYGIRRDLQDRLAASGYPVRVYVPYGRYWYPYFMRRLGERPANVWFILSNFFRG